MRRRNSKLHDWQCFLLIKFSDYHDRSSSNRTHMSAGEYDAVKHINPVSCERVYSLTKHEESMCERVHCTISRNIVLFSFLVSPTSPYPW